MSPGGPAAARIGVVSDTHLPRFGRRLPAPLVAGLEAAGVALILHLGDHTSPDVAGLFEAIAPFEAVAGNNDGDEIERRWGRRRIVTVGRVRLGMVHGDLGRGRTTPDRAVEAFRDDPVDAVLFGHSHVPLCERRDGVLLLNPGSPTDRRRNPAFSWALLDVAPDGTLTAEHRYFDRR